MTLPRSVRRFMRLPRFGRRQLEREIDDEISFHIALRAERLRARGVAAAEADAEAARRFGDPAAIRAACVSEDESNLRRERIMEFLEHTIGDLRIAWRSFRRAPGFAIAAFLTLTLGIAAAASVFSYYDAAYHGALPYHDASRLVAVGEVHAKSRFAPSFSDVSADAVRLIRASSRSFERVSAYDQDYVVVAFGNEPQPINALRVDSAFFPLFALRAEIGRLPSPEEIRDGAPVAAISDVLWRSRYGASPAGIGQRMTIHGTAYRIVGVLPAQFRFPYQTDLITPLPERALGDTVGTSTVSLVAKLRPGATRASVRAELAVIGHRLAASGPRRLADASLVLRDEPLDRHPQRYLPYPVVFLGASLLVLFIACANVANLFAARWAQRRGELAVRASMGAGTARILRHIIAESALLSIVASAAGTLVALGAVKYYLHLVPTSGFPSWFHVGIQRHMLELAVALAIVATLIGGLLPARNVMRFDLVGTLKGAADVMASRRVGRGNRRGVVLQLALAAGLFVAAALMLRSYAGLAHVDVGYPAAQIALAEPGLNGDRYPDAVTQTRFATDVVDAAVETPGIARAAVIGFGSHLRGIPDSVWERRSGSSRLIPDGDSTRAIVDRSNQIDIVSDQYFSILHLRTMSGRTFGPADREGGAPAAVISARAAALLWPHESPIGHALQVGADGERLTVIGVVSDTRDLGMSEAHEYTTEPRVTAYLSTRQAVSWHPQIIAAGPGNVATVRRALVGVIHGVDRMVLLAPRETTMAAPMEYLRFGLSMFGGIIGALALVAFALAIVGVYGVVAFGVAQREREVGIRMALGATSGGVVRLVITDTLRFAWVGVLVGFAIAALGSRLLRTFLFETSRFDPLVYGVVAAVFAGVAVFAAYLPARRAARLDPVVALRSE
jgi:putative ABC transport system permease protein